MTINPTLPRANAYSLRGYGAILIGTQVLEATVTANAATLSETSLSISIDSGDIADVERGYRVQFFSAGGDFKGETHVRWGDTLDTTHLPVREFSQSEFLIVAGDVIRVFSLVAFEDKLITGDESEQFNPDGVPVGTYNSTPAPLVASGGYDAGFVDGYETGTPLTYRTVLTNGAPSMVLDPDSTPGNLSHLWTFPTGVALAPGSLATDASPTFRVDVGEYTVHHAVTDNDNGQTWTQHPVYSVYDGVTRSPVSVVMEMPPTGDPEQGWTCTFRAVNFLNLTDAPDGSLFVFFVRERINGAWQSLGGTTGRSAVKLVGYLSHDESDLTPQLQYQRFEVISPLTRLGMTPGFSKLLIQNNTANDWTKLRVLDTLLAIIQYLRIYTFGLDGGHDLLVSSLYLNLPYPELWAQKMTPRLQVNEMADGTDARFTCTRTGLFRLDPVMQLLSPADRATLTPVYTFSRRDAARLVARRNQLDTVEMLELHATSASAAGDIDAVGAYFSRAPGSPGHGAEFITIERIIVDESDPQDDANARAGRRYGWRNGVYTDSATGEKRRAPEVDLEMSSVYDFLDFDDQIVRFASFPNPRGVDLTAFDWVLSRVRLDYGSGRVISTFQALTDSPAGESYFPPDSSVNIPPSPPIVYPIAVPSPIPPYNGSIPTRAVSLSTSGPYCGLATSFNPITEVITWVDRSTGLAGSAYLGGYSNPYSYIQFYADGDVGIESTLNIAAGSAFTLLQSNAARFGGSTYRSHQRGARHNLNGWHYALSGSNCLSLSFDGLVTVLSPISINGLTLDPATAPGSTACALAYSPHNAHGVYALAPANPSTDTNHSALYSSSDDGRTWTLLRDYNTVSNPTNGYYGDTGRQWLDIPYKRLDGSDNLDNASLEIWMYTEKLVSGGPGNTVRVSQDRGLSYPVSLGSGGASDTTNANSPHPLSSFTYGLGNGLRLDGLNVRRTTDGWQTQSATLFNVGNATALGVNGWSSNPDPVVVYGGGNDGVFAISLNGVDFFGNVPSFFPDNKVAYAEFSLYTVQ